MSRRVFSLEMCIRTATGLVAAPLVGALAGGSLYVVLHTQFGNEFTLANLFGNAVLIAVIGIISGFLYGVPYALFVGWPAHLLLLRFGLTSVFVYVCLAASATAAFASVFVAPSFGFDVLAPKSFLELISSAAIAGGIGGLVFWLIRRPDRDAVSASQTP